MIGWIRVDTAIDADPKVGFLADRLGVDEATVVGHLVFLWAKMAAHAKDGNLTDIPHQTLERWAGWRGERGAFSVALRSFMCRDDGIMNAWDKHNGVPIRKAEADADRKRKAHEPPRDRRAEVRATPEGTDGRTDGRDERKDSVSKETGHAEPDIVSENSVMGVLRKYAYAPDGKDPAPGDGGRDRDVMRGFVADGHDLETIAKVIQGVRRLADAGELPGFVRRGQKFTLRALTVGKWSGRDFWERALSAYYGNGSDPPRDGKRGGAVTGIGNVRLEVPRKAG